MNPQEHIDDIRRLLRRAIDTLRDEEGYGQRPNSVRVDVEMALTRLRWVEQNYERELQHLRSINGKLEAEVYALKDALEVKS